MPVTSNMQKIEIWLIIQFLSRKKFHAKQIVLLICSSMKLGPDLLQARFVHIAQTALFFEFLLNMPTTIYIKKRAHLKTFSWCAYLKMVTQTFTHYCSIRLIAWHKDRRMYKVTVFSKQRLLIIRPPMYYTWYYTALSIARYPLISQGSGQVSESIWPECLKLPINLYSGQRSSKFSDLLCK